MKVIEEQLLDEINSYFDDKKRCTSIKEKRHTKNLIRILKVYFGKEFTTIRELPKYKKKLEESRNEKLKKDMLICFNLYKEGIIFDKYFDRSWEELWEFANKNEIYETQNFLDNKRALEMVRHLLLTMKENNITREETTHIINYEACFKSLEEENLAIFMNFISSFTTYYKIEASEQCQNLTLLQKILHAKKIAEASEKEKKPSRKKVIL